MMKNVLCVLITLLLVSSIASAQEVTLSQEDVVLFTVASYVNGFNNYNTTITTDENRVDIVIYYDVASQIRRDAYTLANTFKSKVPELLKKYPWAEEIKVTVSLKQTGSHQR